MVTETGDGNVKKLFWIIAAVLLLTTQAEAAPQLGITPCPTQPQDLNFSAASSNRKLLVCGETLVVFNNSTSDARVKFGTASTTTAALTDILVPQKTYVVFNVGTQGPYIAAISSGSGTLSFIQGTAN